MSSKNQQKIEKVLRNNQSAQVKDVIKSAFKKPREISSIVKKKIQSGQLSRDEVQSLHTNENPLTEVVSDQDNVLRFINIKPGNYKVVVRETETVSLQSFDILIDSLEEDQIEKDFQLAIKELGTIDLKMIYPVNNIVQKMEIKN